MGTLHKGLWMAKCEISSTNYFVKVLPYTNCGLATRCCTIEPAFLNLVRAVGFATLANELVSISCKFGIGVSCADSNPRSG